jgi:hypothetical protein
MKGTFLVVLAVVMVLAGAAGQWSWWLKILPTLEAHGMRPERLPLFARGTGWRPLSSYAQLCRDHGYSRLPLYVFAWTKVVLFVALVAFVVVGMSR